MKKLALLLLIAPAVAAAEKSYNMETNVTHDCATEPEVSINVSEAVFALTGTCKQISINGSENTITIGVVNNLFGQWWREHDRSRSCRRHRNQWLREQGDLQEGHQASEARGARERVREQGQTSKVSARSRLSVG